MARIDTLTNFLTDIANAIRNKKGTTDTILASNFDTEIESIETGIEPTGTIDITENGTYDVTEYASANVNVSGGTDTSNQIVVFSNFTELNEHGEGGYPKKATIQRGVYNSTTDDGKLDYSVPQYLINNSSASTSSFWGQIEEIDFNIENIVWTQINQYAFSYLTNLITINLPDTITAIGNLSFRNCVKLILNKLPDSLTSIGEYGFYYCYNLILTSLPSNLTTIGSYAFGMTSSMRGDNINLTELPETLYSIGTYAFQYCNNSNLMIMDFSNINQIKTIGSNAFSYNKLSKLSIINNNATNYITLGTYAFQYNQNLTEATLDGNINTNNSTYCFQYCTLLKKFTVKPSETGHTIGSYFFRGCSVLDTLIIDSEIYTVSLSGTNVFTNTPIASGTGYIYVADSLVDTYKSMTNWSTYANQIKPISELPTEVES